MQVASQPIDREVPALPIRDPNLANKLIALLPGLIRQRSNVCDAGTLSYLIMNRYRSS